MFPVVLVHLQQPAGQLRQGREALALATP